MTAAVRNDRDLKRRTISLIHAHIIRVISSPSNSTTGFVTLIRLNDGGIDAKFQCSS